MYAKESILIELQKPTAVSFCCRSLSVDASWKAEDSSLELDDRKIIKKYNWKKGTNPQQIPMIGKPLGPQCQQAGLFKYALITSHVWLY